MSDEWLGRLLAFVIILCVTELVTMVMLVIVDRRRSTQNEVAFIRRHREPGAPVGGLRLMVAGAIRSGIAKAMGKDE